MISTDFATNESWDDAWLSLMLLFQPCKWKSGKETQLLKEKFTDLFIKNVCLSNGRDKMVYFFLSGRAALYFLLNSLKLQPGSNVVLQAFTCEAVILPILANYLKPIYIDIETETFSMDYHSLINRLTDNCRVLILQHTFGLTPKFRAEILKLAAKRNLIVIEDLAHGFNPKIFSPNNTYQLTNNYYLLSFGRSKFISSVFGGAILSSNNLTIQPFNHVSFPSYWFIFLCLLYKPLTMLIKSTYDFYIGKILHKLLNSFNLLIPEITLKEKAGEYDKIFNKAYPNALAILLLHQLKKFEQIQKQRARICKYYSGVILNSTTLRMTERGLIRFPLLLNNRDKTLALARKSNIFLGKWYDQVVAPKDLNLDSVGYKSGSCPKAEEISRKIINLPTNISEREAKKVASILDDVISLNDVVSINQCIDI